MATATMREPTPGAPELRVQTTEDESGVRWVVACLVWPEGPVDEIARVRRELLASGDEAGGDPLFHGWLDAVGAIFRRRLEQVSGVEHQLKRVAAGRRRHSPKPPTNGDAGEE